MKVLLLNPPSSPPVLRDMSCGETVKASYYWAPIDLLVLSAAIPPDVERAVLDATAERLDPGQALSRACAHRPDVVASLVSAVSIESDLAFLTGIKGKTGASVAVMGDLPSFSPGTLLKRGIDAEIPDFTDERILPYFRGEMGMAGGLLSPAGSPEARSRTGRELSYGIPRHDLFPMRRYAMPYSLHRPVATMMMSYGCPFRCSFCASGKLGYRPRNLADFLAEYDFVASLGIREFFLRDLTFGVERDRAIDFCDQLARRRKMVWSCEARLDTVDPELLSSMKNAGCHLVMLGVETPDPEALKASSKGYGTSDRATPVFRAARRAGLSTLAHFIIGFPGDTEDSIRRMIAYASSLECDFASFNLMVPRLGSDLRVGLTGDGVIDESDLSNLDCSTGGRSLCSIPVARLEKLRRSALRSFYGKPARLFRLARRSMTPSGIANLARNAAGVVRSARNTPRTPH
ncbi:MAG: radical SAM protein [Candidatus Fermentibacteraceae bacterium]